MRLKILASPRFSPNECRVRRRHGGADQRLADQVDRRAQHAAAGAQWFVLSGDPTKAGPFTVRLRLPAGYQIPAHSHPTTEAVTVLSGKLAARHGRQVDPKRARC